MKYRLQQIGLAFVFLLLAVLWLLMFIQLSNKYLTMPTNELIWLLFVMCMYSGMIAMYYKVSDKIIKELTIKITEKKLLNKKTNEEVKNGNKSKRNSD